LNSERRGGHDDPPAILTAKAEHESPAAQMQIDPKSR